MKADVNSEYPSNMPTVDYPFAPSAKLLSVFPLHHAVHAIFKFPGLIEPASNTIEILLKSGANPNAKGTFLAIDEKIDFTGTALMLAIVLKERKLRCSNLDAVIDILQKMGLSQTFWNPCCIKVSPLTYKHNKLT